MKSKFVASLLFMLLLTPLAVFAAANNKETVSFPHAVTVGGTEVPAGTYKVEWQDTGAGTITIHRGKKVIATAPATVIHTKSRYDGALHFQDEKLQAIYWRDTTVEFSPAPTGAANGK